MKKGFTLVEVLVGTALILIIFVGIFGAYQLGLKVIGQSKARAIATALGNQQIERVRNLPYEKVGVAGGYPSGDIPAVQSTTTNNIEYTIETRVDYIDDEFDGLAPNDDCPDECDETKCPNDYKKIRVKVSWPGKFGGEVKFNTIVVPRDIYQECGETGGVLLISAFNAKGEAVEFPYFEVENLDTGLIKTAHPEQGEYRFVLPEGIDVYKIKITKDGYSSEQTYGSGDVYNGQVINTPIPERSHAKVLEGQLSEVSFCIDKLSKFLIKTLEAKANHIYYVRKTGSDDNDGLSPDSAFLTIQKAGEVMVKGDIVFIGAGIYEEQISPQNSGTASEPISYVADKAGLYTKDAGEVKIKGESYGFYIENKAHLQIYGFKITNASSSGIWISGSSADDIQLVDNEIYNNLEDGVHIEDADKVILSHNNIYSNQGSGIELKNSNLSSLIANRIYNNNLYGVNIENCSNLILNFNNCYSNQKEGILMTRTNSSWLTNNISYLNKGDGIRIFDNSSSHLLFNKSYSNQGFGISFEKNISNSNVIKSNLLYKNGKSGISLSDNCIDNIISHNTCFQNQENGVLIEADSNNNELKDNIIVNNGLAGISVINSTNTANSYNDVWNNNPNYQGVSAGEGEISDNPLFVDPDGEDDILGGNNGEDDCFCLSQVSAGQSQDSSCVDSGSGNSSDLGMEDKTTRSDNIGDSGIVDMGYHYNLASFPSLPSLPDPFGAPIDQVSFELLLKKQGEEEVLVGYTIDGDPIYKYSETFLTDFSGYAEASDLEWGSYLFSDFSSAGTELDLIISYPPQLVNLSPDSTQEVKLGLRAENTLLISAQDASTTEPLFSARVRVYKTGYDREKLTDENGQAYFIPLEQATYNLEVKAEGYATSTDTVWVSGHTEKLIGLDKIE